MNRLHTFLIYMVSMILVSFLVWFSLSRSDYRVLAFAACIPFALYFMNRPDTVLILAVGLMYSGVSFPGLPGALMAYHLFVLLYIGLWVLAVALRPQQIESRKFYAGILMLFLINIALVMYWRGAGFRFLGDRDWGGFRYVQILLALGFLLSSSYIKLTVRQWKIAMLLLSGLAMLPSLAEFLLLISRGRLYHLYYVVRLRSLTLTAFVASEDELGLVRFYSARSAGTALMMLAFMFVGFRGLRKYLFCAMMALSFGFIAFTGHRASILELAAFVWLYGFVNVRISYLNYILTSLLGLVLVLMVVYATAVHFPLPVQRAVSFLPNIQVDSVARDNAMETLEWRLNLWKEGWNELRNNPDYWVIGKGYTFSNEEMDALRLGRPGEYNYWWAVINTTYHNGPLSLLIGLGLSGLIIGSLILVAFSRRHYRFLKGHWESPRLKQFFHILCLYNLASIFVFFVIYGDAFNNYPVIIYRVAILEAIYFSDRKLKRDATRQAEVTTQEAEEPMPRMSLPPRFRSHV
ncbi:MAG: O-antigen ligase family protein [Verrucomicrobia bacterium]|nr:O-antigen ligase family protein [Verrucomicrobiota bacterium]MCH8511787.1 O-antigen ligase family protein [Kiritimatiellia bacterium]